MDFTNSTPGVALKNVSPGWWWRVTLRNALLLLNGAWASHVSFRLVRNLYLIGHLVSYTMTAMMKVETRLIDEGHKRQKLNARLYVHLGMRMCSKRVEHVEKMVIGKE